MGNNNNGDKLNYLGDSRNIYSTKFEHGILEKNNNCDNKIIKIKLYKNK